MSRTAEPDELRITMRIRLCRWCGALECVECPAGGINGEQAGPLRQVHPRLAPSILRWTPMDCTWTRCSRLPNAWAPA